MEGGIRGERGRTNATEKGLGRRTAKEKSWLCTGLQGEDRESASERASGNKGKIEGETRVRPVGGSTGVNTSRRRTCVRFVERGGVEGGERGDEEAAKEEEGAGGGRK